MRLEARGSIMLSKLSTPVLNPPYSLPLKKKKSYLGIEATGSSENQKFLLSWLHVAPVSFAHYWVKILQLNSGLIH